MNDAEVHISGVFGEDLLQEHEQQRRRLSWTLCVRPVPSTSKNRATQKLSAVLMQLPADTRTSSLCFCAPRKRRAAAHRMDDRRLEPSTSFKILAWSRWLKRVDTYLSESTPWRT